MLKYVVLTALAATAAAAAAAAVVAEQPSQPGKAAGHELTWTEVIECYKQPRAAIGCLESRMGRALVSMRDSAVRMARGASEVPAEDAAGVGNLVQEVGEFISYGMTSYFRGEDAAAPPSAAGASPTDVDEGRGHHKKKKIQKEIKKFVLKILFGIYLFNQKIKMILMSIQSILMSKFLIVAMLYALSNTFKIWYDIKWDKHHHHDKVVYYENAHHQHHYEPPEHSEYDDHHGWGGSIWGRSILATEPSVVEHGNGGGPSGSPHDGITRYIRRVSRTAQPTAAAAQTMAFAAQQPAQ